MNNKRRTFTTTINLDMQRQFKAKCAENGIKMNDLLETFMQMYVKEKFVFDDNKNIVAKENG